MRSRLHMNMFASSRDTVFFITYSACSVIQRYYSLDCTGVETRYNYCSTKRDSLPSESCKAL